MTELKAIETVFSGYKFRSRLEARWAVFFDALDMPYEYEKEGFELPSGWYLPDFWLPEQNLWVEIKPYKLGLEDKEVSLAYELYEASDNDVAIFMGSIPLMNKTKASLKVIWGDDTESYSTSKLDHEIQKYNDLDIYVFMTTSCPAELAEEARSLGFDPLAKIKVKKEWVHRWANNMAQWIKCPTCEKIMMSENAFGRDIKCHPLEIYCDSFEEPIEAAYLKARQARFEHGEKIQ